MNKKTIQPEAITYNSFTEQQITKMKLFHILVTAIFTPYLFETLNSEEVCEI